MNPDFWHEKWTKNQIGFHESDVHPMLSKHFDQLSLRVWDRVFVPLCGKSNDLHWLSTQGYRVVGIELSQLAVETFFAQANIDVIISEKGGCTLYQSESFEIFVGDFFDLSAEMLGVIDATYDRAALVALPVSMRKKYADHLAKITNKAPQLLISFDYDQAQMKGPPFSVPAPEIRALYEGVYQNELLSSHAITGKLGEKCQGSENAWLLEAASKPPRQ